MKEEHKKIVKNIIMEDYDLRPSIAEVVVECLINSCERIKEEDDIAEKVTLTYIYLCVK